MFQYIILAYPMYIMYSTLCICIILKYKVLNSLYTIHVIQCIYHIQNIFTYIYNAIIYIYMIFIHIYIYMFDNTKYKYILDISCHILYHFV